MTGPDHTLLLLPVITVFHKCKHWDVRTHTDTRTHSKVLFFIAFTGSDRVMMRTKYHDSLFFHFGGGGKLLSSPHQLSFHLHQTHMGHMYRPAALLRFWYRKCNHSWFEAQLILALSCRLTSIHEGYISVWTQLEILSRGSCALSENGARGCVACWNESQRKRDCKANVAEVKGLWYILNWGKSYVQMQ